MLWMMQTALAVDGPDCQAFGHRTTFTWQTYEELVADEKRRADAELRAPREVPIAWYVHIGNFARSPDEADPTRYLLIVVDAAGKELVRETGRPKVPRLTGESWFASLGGSGTQTAALPVRVYAVDKLMSTRCEWEVAAKEGGGVAVRPLATPPAP